MCDNSIYAREASFTYINSGQHLTWELRTILLRVLSLEGHFTDKAIPDLVKLDRLEMLSLGGDVQISGAGVARLAALPSMQNLNLKGNSPDGNRLEIGDLAPDFEVTTLAGKNLRLRDQRGKWVLLYFYGTWCAPCVASTPRLKQLEKELSQRDDFVMVNLSFGETELLPRAHAEKFGLDWPQVALGLESDIVNDYGVVGAPSCFLIDPTGKLISTTHNHDEIKEAVKGASRQPAAGGNAVPDEEGASLEPASSSIRLTQEKPTWELSETPMLTTTIQNAARPDADTTTPLSPRYQLWL